MKFYLNKYLKGLTCVILLYLTIFENDRTDLHIELQVNKRRKN